MIFNSLAFLAFFPLVCVIYFVLPSKFRNYFLLVASYYFYMNWEPMYALLIFASTATTYGCSLLLEKVSKQKKKIVLALSLFLNFGILFTFKYYNFITESVFAILQYADIRCEMPKFTLLLPVGISFYTFQAVGYTIDVYKQKIKAERNFFTYALFVSFFPQLVAGPIERAKNLLPQFSEKHTFSADRCLSALKLMLWGYFMKLCIADQISSYVDAVFNNVENHNGTSMLVAAMCFAFQIYCDFAGYSLIAIGAAKFLGFNLMENFRRPYFSVNFKEFWHRWHISLSTWFTDYVYIPLGGNRVKYTRHLFNLLVTFLISGLWHGANWTFVLWGATHGLLLVFENIFWKLFGKREIHHLAYRIPKMFLVFVVASFAWIFFRANTVTDAFIIFKCIFTKPGHLFINTPVVSQATISFVILLFKEIIDEWDLPIHFLNSKRTWWNITCSILLVCYIMLMGSLEGEQFIYFQF